MPPEDSGYPRDKVLKEIFSDYEKKERRSREEIRKTRRTVLRAERLRRMSVVLGAVIMAVLVFNAAMVIYKETGLGEKPVWANGIRLKQDDRIDACLYEMWQIRKAMDYFYVLNKRFPDSMEEVYESGILGRSVVCPVSGQTYIIKEVGGKKVFACPTPHRHGVAEIWCDVKKGPPSIERHDR